MQPQKDYYAILGLASGVTSEEIKKAYRKLARELHPDANGHRPTDEQEDMAERFKAVAEAYETLGDAEKRAAYDRSVLFGDFFHEDFNDPFGFPEDHQEHYEEPLPASETIVHAGVNVRIEYKGFRSFAQAHVYVNLSDAEILRDNHDVAARAPIYDWYITGEEGKVLFSFYSWWHYDDRFETWKAEAEKEREKEPFNQELAGLREQRDVLFGQGRPIDKLDELLGKVDTAIYRFKDRWRGTTAAHIRSALHVAAKEIERLQAGGSELLVDDLLQGRITHPDTRFNQEILRQLTVLEIRNGGEFIQTLTPEDLRNFYLKQLAGITRYDQMQRCGLRINLEDYAPRDILNELELAPLKVLIKGRKSEVPYDVDYQYLEIDGEIVPVGVVSIPLATYERNAAEYGKASSFPVLPYGIRLLLVVTVDGNEVARGFDDDHLVKRVVKYKRSAGRGRAIAGVGTGEFSGKRWEPIGAYGTPDWFKGKRPRW